MPFSSLTLAYDETIIHVETIQIINEILCLVWHPPRLLTRRRGQMHIQDHIDTKSVT